MPPIRKPRIRSARPWLIGRLAGLHHLTEQIQESLCSEIVGGVFTTTEYTMLRELIRGALERQQRENLDG